MPINQHANFTGSAADLVEIVLASGAAYQLKLDEDKTNERLVRYYVAEGVLDRPERVGRDAAYGYRHLVQFLTARRMVDAGLPLATIARHNQTATTKVLEDGLDRQLPTAAQVLVAQFMQAGAAKEARASPLAVPSAPPGSQSHTGVQTHRTSMALPDVLDEVRQMRDALVGQMTELDSKHLQVGAELTTAMDRLQGMVEQLVHQQDSLLKSIEGLSRRIDDRERRHIDPMVDPEAKGLGNVTRRITPRKTNQKGE